MIAVLLFFNSDVFQFAFAQLHTNISGKFALKIQLNSQANNIEYLTYWTISSTDVIKMMPFSLFDLQ